MGADIVRHLQPGNIFIGLNDVILHIGRPIFGESNFLATKQFRFLAHIKQAPDIVMAEFLQHLELCFSYIISIGKIVLNGQPHLACSLVEQITENRNVVEYLAIGCGNQPVPAGNGFDFGNAVHNYLRC